MSNVRIFLSLEAIPFCEAIKQDVQWKNRAISLLVVCIGQLNSPSHAYQLIMSVFIIELKCNESCLTSVNSLYQNNELKNNKKMLCVISIVMICSSFASFWKFQYFRRSIYKPVEHLWWSFYCKNIEPLSIFTKKLHHRCLLGF